VYNLATAAAAAGINKSTVLRHIKAGKVSATRDQNGGWQIDPAEFHRTFRSPHGQRRATAQATRRYR
jgi:predicted site-specific integrase-resolvase